MVRPSTRWMYTSLADLAFGASCGTTQTQADLCRQVPRCEPFRRQECHGSILIVGTVVFCCYETCVPRPLGQRLPRLYQSLGEF